MKKLIKLIAVVIAAVFYLQITAFASSGDPNIDNGGGDLGSGTSENHWYPGHDGVRVTVIDSQTGAVRSASIDYTNKNESDIRFHFGKVSKAEYVSGRELSVSTGEYVYKTPAQKLPTIISDGGGLAADINKIRSYFTDEQVIRGISNHVGIPFDTLTNGDYKLMIEPIMYITFNGIKTAMTATEAALYNIKIGGGLRSKFAPLSHKNLPLAMFLDKDDLGYSAWKGSTTSNVTDSDIIKYLGIGIVSFKENEDTDEPTDYYERQDYRVDTDVYTSVTITGGEHTPDDPVTVKGKLCDPLSLFTKKPDNRFLLFLYIADSMDSGGVQFFCRHFPNGVKFPHITVNDQVYIILRCGNFKISARLIFLACGLCRCFRIGNTDRAAQS